jgi:hypothetical protein
MQSEQVSSEDCIVGISTTFRRISPASHACTSETWKGIHTGRNPPKQEQKRREVKRDRAKIRQSNQEMIKGRQKREGRHRKSTQALPEEAKKQRSKLLHFKASDKTRIAREGHLNKDANRAIRLLQPSRLELDRRQRTSRSGLV